VVVLLNPIDLLNGELSSSDETRVTSTLVGHELISIEAKRVADISELTDQETTIPTIKMEPNASGVPVVSVTHISYTPYLKFVRPCVSVSL